MQLTLRRVSLAGVGLAGLVGGGWLFFMTAVADAESPPVALVDVPDDKGLVVCGVASDGPAGTAGVKRGDIIVFDRYKDQFIQAGYEANLPDGCKWDWAAPEYDEAQLDLYRYDPDVFADLAIVHAKPGVHDPRDERTRQSHVAQQVFAQATSGDIGMQEELMLDIVAHALA